MNGGEELVDFSACGGRDELRRWLSLQEIKLLFHELSFFSKISDSCFFAGGENKAGRSIYRQTSWVSGIAWALAG